jgi:hypothetical protein
MESFTKRDRGAADSSADDLALPLLAAEEIQRDYSIPPLFRQEALTGRRGVVVCVCARKSVCALRVCVRNNNFLPCVRSRMP